MAKLEKILFYLLLLFLPTQLGKHFWPDFAIVSGIRVDYLSPTLYFTDIMIFLLFGIWCIKRLINSNIEYRSTKQKPNTKNKKRFNFLYLENYNLFRISSFELRIFLVIIAYLVFNILFSHNIPSGLYHLLKFLEFCFVAYYVATTVTSLKKLQQVVFFLSCGVIFESVLAILQFIQQGSIGGFLYFLGERSFTSATPGIANASINGQLLLRPYGTFSHPNVLAGFLVIVMILVLWIFRRSPAFRWSPEISLGTKILKNFYASLQPGARLLKILPGMALVIGTAALLLTMSRVAIVVWLVVLVEFLLLQMKRQRFFLGIVMGVVGVILLVTPIGMRFGQTSFSEEAFVGRQELVSVSWELFLRQPIIGVGFGNFLPSLATVNRSVSPTLYLQPVHNIFLLVLVETGFIGLGFFLWFFVKTYRYLFAHLKTHGGFLLALTVLLVIGLFDHYFLTLQQGQLLFASIVGLCWTKFNSS